ncbi:MAG: hypothetical protein IJM29_07785 [Bacteroidales bacterium]|nr:hypothetical protein [Bacteroidales bacterium]
MNRHTLLILTALFVSAGCDVTEPIAGTLPSGEAAYVNLQLQMQSRPLGTRAGQEDAILDGFILEFDGGGELLECVYFTGESLPVLQVRKYQQMEIYIVANPTVDLSGITNRQEFLSSQSVYSSGNTDRFEMTGYVSGVFLDDSLVNVRMERMLSKITLDAFTIRVNKSEKYTRANFTLANMERTPSRCRYDYSTPEDFLNAYTQRIGVGYYTSYPISVSKYTQGDYTVWEYNYPQSVYCFPNDSESNSSKNRLAVSYKLAYSYTGVDAATGETVLMSHTDEGCIHLFLPPLLPNTEYELERLTVTGYRNRSVYLETKSAGEDESDTCLFRMTDMTSGEYLGYVEGEVEYETIDS